MSENEITEFPQSAPEPTQTPARPPQQWAEYGSTQEAPAALRTLDGARLSLEQINTINRRAYELGSERIIPDSVSPEGKPVKGGTIHVQNFHAARGEFREKYLLQDDLWVLNPKAVN